MQDTQAAAVVDYARGPAAENRRRGHDPQAVLDYAPSPMADPAVRRLRALLVILVCMFGGGLAGWIFSPRQFQATGYMHVATDDTMKVTSQPLSLNSVDERQADIAAGLTAPANLNAAAATLPPAVAPNAALTADDLAERLNVRPVAQSRLVVVTFVDRDARTAAAAVNAVMRSSVTPRVQIAAAATPPARPQRSLFLPIAGAAVGLLAGMFIVARRWK